jgi:uncharacterized surface protein with fasciclin (FAS1) repeats
LHTKLATELKETFISKLLQQPSFSGTVFAPVKSIFSALHNDISVLGDQQLVTDLFRTAVLPGRYTLNDLKHGAQLATLNGLTVDVTVVRSGVVQSQQKHYSRMLLQFCNDTAVPADAAAV